MRFLLFPGTRLTAVRTGEYHTDIRLYDPAVHNLLQGEMFTAVFANPDGQSEEVEMVTRRSAEKMKASELTDSHARDAGFASAQAFRARLMSNDPTVTPDSMVVINRFDVDDRTVTPRKSTKPRR